MTVKTSVSLTDQQEAFARSLVTSGQYASLSSVIQQGLDLLRAKTESQNLERDALRTLLEQRRSGNFTSGADMEQKIRKIAAEKRRDQNI